GLCGQLKSFARWKETQWRFFERLDDLVRTGRGLDIHHTLDDANSWSYYQRAMFEAARYDAGALARLVPVPAGAQQLLDLGGSHGLLGAAICRAHPPMRSTVIDLPQAVVTRRPVPHDAA